jgi:ubiquinone/menaquinone biosynthesis C-methylase UbiE
MAANAKEDGEMSEAHLFGSMTFPEIYERVLVQPLFRPFAEALIERLQPQSSDSLVDVACGTGIIARIGREKLGPHARVAGIDIAPPMLAVARSADGTIDWREGNAASLPIGEEERFSLVTCHQGLQFFPDKAAGVREMRRVISPGGRLAVACWLPLSDLPVARELNEVAERYVGAIADSRHSFGNAGGLKALLVDAGFTDVRVDTFSHDVRFPDGGLFARLNAMAVVGMTAKGKAMNEAERGEVAGRIAADSQEIVARLTNQGTFVFPLATNIATAIG